MVYTIIYTIFGPEPILYILAGSSFIFIGISIIFTYFMGVLLDRAYVQLWRKMDEHFRRKEYPCLNNYNIAQALIAEKCKESSNELLNFYRSRIRILRGSMVNFFLIAIFGACAANDSIGVATFICISALLISSTCFLGFKDLSQKLYKKTSILERELSSS
ncbi:MAG: hypothetical protein CMP47_10795 [Rickettsiales bacterium]|nr:hypothetical protein [Rickettsiales bacterium]